MNILVILTWFCSFNKVTTKKPLTFSCTLLYTMNHTANLACLQLKWVSKLFQQFLCWLPAGLALGLFLLGYWCFPFLSLPLCPNFGSQHEEKVTNVIFFYFFFSSYDNGDNPELHFALQIDAALALYLP